MNNPTPDVFDRSIRIFDAGNAERYAAELFRESFNQPFPVPRDGCGLSIPTPPHAWRQYVANYHWADGRVETIGFCNWIKYEEVYLQGGMCVRENVYRRMPRSHFAACRARGGIAQMMMAQAERELDDCVAWFGTCGDGKALIVDLRAGYEKTDRPHLIVKWFRDLPPEEREPLIAKIAAIGPF